MSLWSYNKAVVNGYVNTLVVVYMFYTISYSKYVDHHFCAKVDNYGSMYKKIMFFNKKMVFATTSCAEDFFFTLGFIEIIPNV